jgi:subtilisin family serine protease
MPAKKTAAKKATVKKTTAKKADVKTAKSLTKGKARTVIYCHGIGNKPPEAKLRSDWDHALFGTDQGERTRMAYWVDRQRYPKPEGLGTRALSLDIDSGTSPIADLAYLSIQSSDDKKKSAAFVAALQKDIAKAAKNSSAAAAKSGAPHAMAVEAKGIFSPIVDGLTQIFLADVNDFLFNKANRTRMVQTVKDRMLTGGGPFVVIGHSQGTMVTYQALMELGNKVEVELFVTLGSPLGLGAVRAELKNWHGKNLPIPPCVKRWVNVARDGDIVSADQRLAGDYTAPGKAVEDFNIDGFSFPSRKAHDVGYYLSYHETRKAVMAAVDKSRFQQVGAFTVAKDLASALDDDAAARVPVLIELVDRAVPGQTSAAPAPLAATRTAVVNWIGSNVLTKTVTADSIALEDELDRYVSANLTRTEVESLAAALGQFYGNSSPTVYRMFSNSRKKALMRDSVQTIQARTAQLGYSATGKGITWAVLDTGIDSAHPHFKADGSRKVDTIEAAWNCTLRGKPVPDKTGDYSGHGTHVAGIIAGGLKDVGGDPECDMTSVAPLARLVSYKVLGDDGSGYDAWIIKAIDHVWAQNEQARRLVIHGVNLSLGGPFDPASFACGDSPLCSSLFRLIRQGVVVVIAAGNEGSGEILVDGNAATLSLDLSIGDPANLEEAIAVGSVHPTLPHRYGTSYFSSRGPTADGRIKPDVVAPGERIWSCRAGGRGKTKEDLYIELSGTSMAAPHVSGLLAAFLSVRREFIGHPHRVKEILLAHCTDLKRDRYHQGAGLPNLAKMLLNT